MLKDQLKKNVRMFIDSESYQAKSLIFGSDVSNKSLNTNGGTDLQEEQNTILKIQNGSTSLMKDFLLMIS